MKKQSDVHVRVTAQEKSLMMRYAEKEASSFRPGCGTDFLMVSGKAIRRSRRGQSVNRQELRLRPIMRIRFVVQNWIMSQFERLRVLWPIKPRAQVHARIVPLVPVDAR